MHLSAADTQRYKTFFEPGPWFNSEVANMVTWLNPEIKTPGVYGRAGSLALLERFDRQPAKLKNVFEFGGGYGNGLLALDMFMAGDDYDARLTGSELDEEKRAIANHIAVQLHTMPTVVPDGFEFLESTPPGSLDLIFAGMFGTFDTEEEMVERFVRTGWTALSEGGVLLAHSDYETMETMIRVAETQLEDDTITVLNPDKIDMPEGLDVIHLILKKPLTTPTAV